MEEMQGMNITLRDYLKVIFRQKVVVIVAILTVLITVAIGLKFKTQEYVSSVKVLISAEKQVESPYYRELMGMAKTDAALTQSEIVTSNPVVERAVRAVGLYQRPLNYERSFASVLKRPFIDLNARNFEKRLSKATEEQKKGYLFRMAVEDLKAHIKVEPIRDTNLFTISVRDFSPIGATVLANIVSRSYVIFDLEQQLAELQLKYGEKHLAVLQLKDSIDKMSKGLTGEPLSAIEAIGPASVKIIEQASIPMQPSGPSKVLTLLLAFFMSIFLGVMLAFGFEYMDQSFKSPADIENYLNLPYLGSVPAKAQPLAYQTISEQVYLMMRDRSFKTLMFTASLPSEGVSTIVANIGRCLAETEKRKVLVISANFRHIQKDADDAVSSGYGLADVIEGAVPLEKAVNAVGPHLSVLATGNTEFNPITLLDSVKMSELLKAASAKYDLVFIDAPNLRNHKDALLLANRVDAVVVIVNEGKTRRQVVQNALGSLQQKKTTILGVILNNRTYALPKAIYDRF